MRKNENRKDENVWALRKCLLSPNNNIKANRRNKMWDLTLQYRCRIGSGKRYLSNYTNCIACWPSISSAPLTDFGLLSVIFRSKKLIQRDVSFHFVRAFHTSQDLSLSLTLNWKIIAGGGIEWVLRTPDLRRRPRFTTTVRTVETARYRSREKRGHGINHFCHRIISCRRAYQSFFRSFAERDRQRVLLTIYIIILFFRLNCVLKNILSVFQKSKCRFQ